MTTRTGIATHGIVSTTPRGEVHVHGTNALQRDLFFTPAKARSLACALLCEANNADQEQQPMPAPQVWIGENSGGFGQFMPSTWGLTRN